MAVKGGMVGRGVYQRVPQEPGRGVSDPDNRRRHGVPTVEGRPKRCAILSNRSGGWARPDFVCAVSGEPMTEILTESFCERCGTRYTFESARPRIRLKGVKTVSRGLKNFVLSDETSMDEAMAAARADTEREATSYQLDAFHKTFNFCMSCRQYTCPNCWNEAEARCLTCAPHLGRDVLPAPFPDLAVTGAVGYEDLTAGGAIRVEGNGAHAPAAEAVPAPGAESSPAAPDEIDVAARLAALTMTFEPDEVAAEPETVVPAEAFVEPEAVIQPEAVELVEAEAIEPEAIAEPDLPIDAAPETPLFVVGQPDAEPFAKPIESEPAIVSEPAIDLGAAALLADHDPREDAPAAMIAPAKPAGRSKGFFHRFRAGQDIDAELEAYEREQTAAAVAAAAVVVASEPRAIAVVVEPEEIAEPEAVVAGEPEQIEPVAALVEPEGIAEPEAVVAAEPEPVAALVEPEEIAEPEAVVAAEPEPVAALVEPEEIAEPEAVVAAEPEPVAALVEPEEIAEPEAVVAAEPEPLRAVEPEPIAAAEATAEPEAIAAIEPEPVAERAPEPVAADEPAVAVAPEDIVPQPTWRMVAPDPSVDEVEPSSPALPAAASGDPGAEPQWPTRPEWLGKAPAVGLPFLNRPASPQGGVDALWAESNREVASQRSAAKPASAVQPCVSCGLSLSATARFCRRCGSAQG
jgi:hypothetical protein